MSDFYSNMYNPDILTCLANLSNDEVFTPPEVANSMLDLLPQALFSDPDTKFLDPACKSGVFLREIAKRLLTGLEPVIPDLQQRVDEIALGSRLPDGHHCRGRSRRRGKRREHDGKRQLEPEYEKRQNKNKDRGQNGFEDRDPDDLHTAFFQNGELEELAC